MAQDKPLLKNEKAEMAYAMLTLDGERKPVQVLWQVAPRLACKGPFYEKTWPTAFAAFWMALHFTTHMCEKIPIKIISPCLQLTTLTR